MASLIPWVISSWCAPPMNLLPGGAYAASPHSPLRVTSAVLYGEEVTEQERRVISVELVPTSRDSVCGQSSFFQGCFC